MALKSSLGISQKTRNPNGPDLLALDVVIVGGGMAAVMAALAAKTPDNRVLMVEPSNVLGGQGTAGGVAGFCGDTAHVNKEFAELIAQLSRHGLIEPFQPNNDRRAYDLEWCAFFLQEMVVARGIEVLLHSRVIAARANGGKIIEVTVSTGGELLVYAPRFVIDASGACVVPMLCGFEVMHEGTNRQLPMSLYFTLWDTGRPANPILPPACPCWKTEEEIPMTSIHAFPTGKIEVKMKVVGFDAADGFSRSAAELFARRQMHGLIYFLQTVGYRGRKFDTHVLASVARGIGIREERRILGEHMLTEQEARRAVIFPDAVAVNTYHIDYHWPDRMERADTGISDMLDPHHLPLSMMIPRGARNLLVPGRGASGDQMAMSAFRVMAVVAQMGFAAGHAARQCLETDTDLTTIDIRQLQAVIKAGGQSLNLSDYGEYLRSDRITQEEVLVDGVELANNAATALLELNNGRFLAAWYAPATEGSEPGKIWTALRREKQWFKASQVISVPLEPEAKLQLDFVSEKSVRLTFGSIPASLHAWESVDDGATWHIASNPAGNKVIPHSLPSELLGPASRPTFAEMDKSMVAAVFTGIPCGGRVPLIVALSPDNGATWPNHREIDSDSGTALPAIVPTSTGLAIFYAGDATRLMFWHGSIERIIHGSPKAQAHVLQR